MAPDARDLKTFKDYQLALRSSLSNSQLEKFKNLRTNEEKIIFINGLQNFPTFPISKQENRGKNLEEAQKFKEQGNVSFQNKKYNQACWFYSQSILKCPRNRPGKFLDLKKISVVGDNRFRNIDFILSIQSHVKKLPFITPTDRQLYII